MIPINSKAFDPIQMTLKGIDTLAALQIPNYQCAIATSTERAAKRGIDCQAEYTPPDK